MNSEEMFKMDKISGFFQDGIEVGLDIARRICCDEYEDSYSWEELSKVFNKPKYDGSSMIEYIFKNFMPFEILLKLRTYEKEKSISFKRYDMVNVYDSKGNPYLAMVTDEDNDTVTVMGKDFCFINLYKARVKRIEDYNYGDQSIEHIMNWLTLSSENIDDIVTEL